MTDKDTKNAIEEIWSLMRENAKQMKETDRHLKEQFSDLKEQMKEQIKETDRYLKETDRHLKETDRHLKETDRQMKETDRQMKETDMQLREKFSDLKDYVGNVGQNNGAVAESFFYNTLANNMKLGDFTFDFIEANVERQNRRQNIKGEYDIILHNSHVITIVETKYKVHPNDIKKLKEKKLPMFSRLYPDKKDFTLYGAIAGMAFPKKVKELALEQGLFVLTQGGGNIHVEKRNIQKF